MPPSPGILLDTDVLLQILLTRHASLLKRLKLDHGFQASIVPEVEIEFGTRGRRRGVFEDAIRKALESGALELLDDEAIRRRLVEAGISPALASDATSQLADSGDLYSRHVDRGEAYTFAVAVGLGIPAASNDGQAIRTLATAGLALPQPTLRFFDLVVFGLQTEMVTESDAEAIRSRLLGAREYVPPEFRNASVRSGLPQFRPRLIHSAYPLVGSAPVATPPHACALVVPPP